MATSWLIGRESVGWDWMVDHSGEGGGKVVRGDVVCWKVLRVAWRNMCGM